MTVVLNRTKSLKTITSKVIVTVALALMLPACNTEAPANTAPIANAGVDQTVSEQSEVTLNATASIDSEDNIVSFNWNQLSGTAVTLSDDSLEQPTFTAPVTTGNEVLSFEVVVTDGSGAISTDSVDINIFETTPTLINSTPADNATGIERTSTISAVFSEAMLNSSIDSNNFLLQDSNGYIPSSVELIGDTATLTPTNTLNLLSPYTATLFSSITDSEGNSLDADISWSFTTEDGNWNSAELLETADGGRAINPQIAVDADGNAMAVWTQAQDDGDGEFDNIYASFYNVDTGIWGTAVSIETLNIDASAPQIDFDNNGNAMAVWMQGGDIMANLYTAGNGWTAADAMPIEDSAENAFGPQLAFDSNGNAIAVWTQDSNIYVNHFTAGGDWDASAAILIENGAGVATGPQVAFDPTGNVMVVWTQHDGAVNSVFANFYVAGGTWDPNAAAPIETGVGGANEPQIAFDNSGNALAVWYQSDGIGDNENVYSNYYTADSGWGYANALEGLTGYAYETQVAFDNNGDALAIFYFDDTNNENIAANRFTKGEGWGHAEYIDVTPHNAENAQIAIDTNGNAIVVWRQDNGTTHYGVFARRYTRNFGWSETISQVDSEESDVRRPQIAIDNTGNAIVVWEQTFASDSYTSIWANRFE